MVPGFWEAGVGKPFSFSQVIRDALVRAVVIVVASPTADCGLAVHQDSSRVPVVVNCSHRRYAGLSTAFGEVNQLNRRCGTPNDQDGSRGVYLGREFSGCKI